MRRIRTYDKLTGWTYAMVDAPDPRYGGQMIDGKLRCRDCHSPMVLRTRRTDGRFFFGCQGYPLCKRTHPADPHGHPVFPSERRT